TDTEIEISPGAMKVTKQRDMDVVPQLRFELVDVEIGERADGAAVTSCIVNWTSSAEAEFEIELTPGGQLALDALDQVLADRAKAGQKNRLVTFSEWSAAINVIRNTPTGGNQFLSRVSPELIDAGFVIKTEGGQYVRLSRRG